MTTTKEMADFVMSTSYRDLPEDVTTEAKKRVLDSLGIAIGAFDAEPVEILHETVEELDHDGKSNVWGSDLKTSPPLATALNTGMVRYLDYMDSFLVPDESPHPSNNVAAAIVSGEYTDKPGEDLIAAIAIAYEIHWALGYYAPLMEMGWDHPTHVNFSATAASSYLMDLDEEELRNALGIVGTSHNALRVTRTGEIPMWKGMTSGNAARNAVYSTMVAKNGMTGPKDVFEGRQGWKEVVSGDFELKYTNCERLLNVMTKKYMAGTYAQSALEALEDLMERDDIESKDIEHIHVDTYKRAKLVMGGTGKENEMGNRYEVRTRETADHSLPYTLAALALDGEISYDQYELDRIRSPDVQEFMDKITIEEAPELTDMFENDEMPAYIDITTKDGSTHRIEKDHFSGHPNDPMSWEQLEEKFNQLAAPYYSAEKREEIVDCVKNLEAHSVRDLTTLLTPVE